LFDLIDRGVMLMAMAGWGFLKKFFWIQCWDFNLKVNSVQNGSGDPISISRNVFNRTSTRPATT
jgi:hypothetical protein